MHYEPTINITPVTLISVRKTHIILVGLRAFDIVTGRAKFNNRVKKKDDANTVSSSSLLVVFLACI